MKRYWCLMMVMVMTVFLRKEGIFFRSTWCFLIARESSFGISISMKWQWTAEVPHSSHYNFLLLTIVSITRRCLLYGTWWWTVNMSQCGGPSFFLWVNTVAFSCTYNQTRLRQSTFASAHKQTQTLGWRWDVICSYHQPPSAVTGNCDIVTGLWHRLQQPSM